MWVELPEGTDVDALFDAAAERGVQFVKGTDFLLEGGENTLRLAYSASPPTQIDEGVARLAEALPVASERRLAAVGSDPTVGRCRRIRATQHGPRRRHASRCSPTPVAAVALSASTSCSGSAMRGGGDGSASTETVSATLAVTRRSAAVGGLDDDVARRRWRRRVPSRPGSSPLALR